MSGATSTPDGDALDLGQFFQIFFEEADENLQRMEQLLLDVDLQAADDETLNAIFRCAHSVKGGAATFGFTGLAELTHDMETLLDRLRRRELEPNVRMVDVLLQSGDAMRAHLDRYRCGGDAGDVDDSALRASLRALAEGVVPEALAAPIVSPADSTLRKLELVVGPLESPEQADQLVELFNEIQDLGVIERLDAGQSEEGMRRFFIRTTSSDEELLDLFTFYVDRNHVRLQPMSDGYGFHEGAPGVPASMDCTPAAASLSDADSALAPVQGAVVPSGEAANVEPRVANELVSATDVTVERRKSAGASSAGRAATGETSTLRVSVEKVDQLINLVGELVITQAMLAQNSAALDSAVHEQMAAGLADLEHNTRNLQESVMSIRMIPMSVVFNRFPRMLRDLAGRLGKKVDFVTRGEATELDKGVIEKIIDPLTHLVRNSCDHGIELPDERRAAGKPEAGTISLSASHQGGSIVIEVCDDGSGLPRAKLLAKARERGFDVSEATPDAEVWNLVFAPGFSTAGEVTDVSGRGVGMDVVKKNIVALGGTVEIDSCEGRGMSVKVRLPLTLAIMDGMSVAVGRDCYIIPLASVVESFQSRDATIRTIGGGGQVVQVREEYLSVVDLKQVFAVPSDGPLTGMPIMVVVESEGRRAVLVVDALVGQQQVVVKNLEANYRRVDGISGATILGDGRVALILDVASLARRVSEPRGASQWVH